jgi:hypothetical protein
MVDVVEAMDGFVVATLEVVIGVLHWRTKIVFTAVDSR